jgi:hypothetical protein
VKFQEPPNGQPVTVRDGQVGGRNSVNLPLTPQESARYGGGGGIRTHGRPATAGPHAAKPRGPWTPGRGQAAPVRPLLVKIQSAQEAESSYTETRASGPRFRV